MTRLAPDFLTPLFDENGGRTPPLDKRLKAWVRTEKQRKLFMDISAVWFEGWVSIPGEKTLPFQIAVTDNRECIGCNEFADNIKEVDFYQLMIVFYGKERVLHHIENKTVQLDAWLD